MAPSLATLTRASRATPGDRRRSERTIPRGSSAADTSRAPGVDPDLWLLHVRYERTGDPDLLAALVAEYDQYAVALAARLRRSGESMDDLAQVAREGLIVALQRFDTSRSLPFPAFATPTILGAVRRHYRDRGWAIRVPRRVHEITMAVRDTEERLTAVIGRSPTVAELAEEIGITVDELLEAKEASHSRATASLDAHHDGGLDLGDTLGAPDPDMDRAITRLALEEGLDRLGEREQELVRLYYDEELSQAEIAGRFGVSQMQVSRWLASIVRRLRRSVAPELV